MKSIKLTALLFSAILASHAMAQTTETVATSGPNSGKVINSTFTFSNIGVSGTGNFNLDGTTITNLNSLVPPVTLQLILTSITYTEQSVTGNGQTPFITFDLTPTLGNTGNNLPSIPVTLFASGPIANGVTDTNVVFSLTNPSSNPDPVVWAPVAEMNPGNTNNNATWQESLSNLEPNPDSITTGGGTTFVPSSVQNGSFTFGGTVEVFYAVPEPNSGWLAILAGFGIAALYAARRRTVKSA
jgi:hypothetical protein